jgi:chromate transporter
MSGFAGQVKHNSITVEMTIADAAPLGHSRRLAGGKGRCSSGGRMAAADSDHGVSFREAVWVWGRVAALSFGGPAGQIAVMHRIIVEEKRWIDEERFLHALNYCMLLPGPEAQQLATYIGWLMHKTKGGLVAGTLFVLPGLVSIMLLSWLYAALGDLPAVDALFMGLKAAVLAIVLEAVWRIGGRALRKPAMILLAASSFVAIFFFDVAFPLIIVAAAVIGFAASRFGSLAIAPAAPEDSLEDAALGASAPAHTRPSWRRSLTISAILLALWLTPVILLVAVAGADNVFAQIATFFSVMAVVTFGGAYAVLAYVAQQAVEHYQWLSPGEMLDGLGLAETTPGPLIMVTQFVGFLAALRQSTGLPPMMAGTLGGLLTTWVTFVPCFLWIFLGAPYIEKLRGNVALAAALRAITAAVVGVMLNLAIWFALHTLFAEVTEVRYGWIAASIPDWTTLQLAPAILAAAALIAVFRFKAGPLLMIPTGAAAGVAYWWLA